MGSRDIRTTASKWGDAEDAPATANRGDEKKTFSAASISSSRFWPLVVGIQYFLMIATGLRGE